MYFWVITPETPSVTLKTATMQPFETPEQTSYPTLCGNPEDLDLSYTCCKSLKACTVFFCPVFKIYRHELMFVTSKDDVCE